MLSTIWDLYDSEEILQAALREGGETDWADRLNNAMLAGSTSGEILGLVRGVLRQLQESNIPKQLGLEKRIAQEISFIDMTLNPRSQ